MIRAQHNIDVQTGARGTEAIDIIVGKVGLTIRWRSAQDGITPHWSLTVWYGDHIKSWTLRGAE